MKALIILLLFSVAGYAQGIEPPKPRLIPSGVLSDSTLAAQVVQLIKDYETLLSNCEAGRELLTAETVRIINYNLVQLQDISQRLSAMQVTAAAAQAQVASANTIVNALQKDLRRLKRRVWFERASGTVVIAALSFFLIKTYL